MPCQSRSILHNTLSWVLTRGRYSEYSRSSRYRSLRSDSDALGGSSACHTSRSSRRPIAWYPLGLPATSASGPALAAPTSPPGPTRAHPLPHAAPRAAPSQLTRRRRIEIRLCEYSSHLSLFRAHPCHICAGNGLNPRHICTRTWAHPRPPLRRDWAHRCTRGRTRGSSRSPGCSTCPRYSEYSHGTPHTTMGYSEHSNTTEGRIKGKGRNFIHG